MTIDKHTPPSFPLDKHPQDFLRVPLTRDVGVSVYMHGEADVPALERLIELLVTVRNHYAGYFDGKVLEQ